MTFGPESESRPESGSRPDPRQLFDSVIPGGSFPGSSGDSFPTSSPTSSSPLSSPGPMSEFNEPSCNLILELLPEAIAGDLDNESELIVSRHVSQCLRCGREWKAFFEAHEALGTIKGTEVEPDVSFFAGLRADILGQIQHQAQELADARALEVARQRGLLPIEPRSRHRSVSLAALAATLLFGILLGTLIGPSTGSARQTRDPNVAGPTPEPGRVIDNVRRVGAGSENRVPKIPGATAEDTDDLMHYLKQARDLESAAPDPRRERSQDF